MNNFDASDWPVISALFDKALDLPAPMRHRWLESLPEQHRQHRATLERLLANYALVETGDFLNALPRVGVSDEPGEAALGNVLHTLGPYRLLRELGRGGMGSVWLAERADGLFKRQVALKLPHPGLATRAFAERLVRERDILASLTHPHIARLYDAGVTAEGQPYMALAYVQGRTLIEHSREHGMSVHGRLKLFLQVLDAVQYAHSHLVIHRDLKPSNVLVDEQGQVHLLDFGIAKLLIEGKAEATELTLDAGLALTPDYASPEQFSGEAISISSDVYSLGVLLYELLTGVRPYRLTRQDRASLERTVLTIDVPRPSEAARAFQPSQVGHDGPGGSARSTAIRSLSRALKGDLDTIVMKALQKRPAERYTTAESFAQDIERYLVGEPVRARRERAWYRAGKFVKRNKVSVGAATAIVVALSITVPVTLWQAHIAITQTRTAEAVQTFLMDIFHANSLAHADPLQARNTTARELLDLGAMKIDSALGAAPEAKVRVLETMFNLYTDLGLQNQAVPIGRSRIDLARSVYGPNHPEVARALVELAANAGESSFAKDRLGLLNEAGSILDRNHDLGSRTRALYYLGMGNVDTDLQESAAFAAKAIKLYRQYPPSAELVSSLNLLGQRQQMQLQFSEAIATLSEAASLANSLQGTARRPLPAIYAVLGEAQRQVLDLDGAERSLRLANQAARSLKGDDSVDVLQTEWRLGNFLVQTSRPKEGLELLRESLDLAVRIGGPDERFHTPMVRRAYGTNLLRYGRLEEAALQMSQLIDMGRQRMHDKQDFALTVESDLLTEIQLGHYKQAESLLQEVFALRKIANKLNATRLDDALMAKAKLLLVTGRANEAMAALNDISQVATLPGALSYSWLNVSLARAEVELGRDRPSAAIDQAATVRKQIIASGLSQYFKRWEAQAALLEGKGLLSANRASEAQPLLEHSVQLGNEVFDHDQSPELADSYIALAACMLELGRFEQARMLLDRAKAIQSTHRELGEHYRKPLRELEARLARRDSLAAALPVVAGR